MCYIINWTLSSVIFLKHHSNYSDLPEINEIKCTNTQLLSVSSVFHKADITFPVVNAFPVSTLLKIISRKRPVIPLGVDTPQVTAGPRETAQIKTEGMREFSNYV